MSTRGSRTLVAVVIIVVAMAAVGATMVGNTEGQSDGPTKIKTCTTISEPGTYVLTKDISNGGGDGGFAYISETCITIDSSNVVLDLQGHTIDGFGISDTTAVGTKEGGQYHDVTVKNAHIKDWNRGVYIGNTDDATVRNVNASDNSFGIFIENARGTTVRGSTANHNFIGLYHTNTRGNTFEGNTFKNNHVKGVVWEKPGETGTQNTSANATATTTTTAATASEN